MRLVELPGDALACISNELGQVVDLCRLVASCMGIRNKLLGRVHLRIEAAKTAYNSADLPGNLKRAVRDGQRHFIRKWKWLNDPRSELAGMMESGDVAALTRLLEKKKYRKAFELQRESWASATASGNPEMLRFLLSENPGHFPPDWIWEAVCSGSASHGSRAYLESALRLLRAKFGSPHEPVGFYALAFGAAKSNDARFLIWILDTYSPDSSARIKTCALVHDRRPHRSADVDRVLRDEGNVPIADQVENWFACGDLEAIRRHGAWLRDTYEPHRYRRFRFLAMENGQAEAVALASGNGIADFVDPDTLASEAWASGNIAMIDKYFSRALVLNTNFFPDPAVLRYALDRLDSDVPEERGVAWIRSHRHSVSHSYWLTRAFPSLGSKANCIVT